MRRRLTITPLLLLILIASIGMPVNVHSCVMAGTSEKSPSCGMCAASHETDDSEGQTGGCCDNHLEIDRADPAVSTKTISLAPPAHLQIVLSWPPLPESETVISSDLFSHPIHGPPPGRSSRAVWLLHSSFLI